MTKTEPTTDDAARVYTLLPPVSPGYTCGPPAPQEPEPREVVFDWTPAAPGPVLHPMNRRQRRAQTALRRRRAMAKEAT